MFPNETEVQLTKLKSTTDLFFILGGWEGKGLLSFMLGASLLLTKTLGSGSKQIELQLTWFRFFKKNWLPLY
jgi:hypothetical protein